MEKNQSFEYFCKTNNKLELLKLYNREKIKKNQMKYIIQEQKNTFLNVQVVIWNGLER